MWRGRMLEILGLMLIVTAFVHYGESSTCLINAGGGAAIALIGTSLWLTIPRRALLANVLGLAVLMAALIPSLRVHSYNMWIAGCGGFCVWVVGWRITASEAGGPWRLRDRPVF